MSSDSVSVSNAFAEADLPPADLAFFFTLSADVMCILDSDGRCLQINPAFEQLLGYSPATMRDRTLASLAHPSDRLTTQATIDQLRLGIANSATNFAASTNGATNRAIERSLASPIALSEPPIIGIGWTGQLQL